MYANKSWNSVVLERSYWTKTKKLTHFFGVEIIAAKDIEVLQQTILLLYITQGNNRKCAYFNLENSGILGLRPTWHS